ncbi:hypothetical protein HYALB_00002037 [Hymenoscyphus albidus]|uniref:Uncharacterized protein n=1 Tax=Hymenoscyphus albidus TaxID=595503 RepID=A0A9N9LFL6_9HELO|nr:hypothetical protein HYALB_00002037 [Hymenoscyphus albidus]
MGRPRGQRTFTPPRCGPTGTTCALSKENRHQNRFQRRGAAEAGFLRQLESATTILEPIEAAHIYDFPENILDKATPQISKSPKGYSGVEPRNLDFATDLIMDELTCFENPGVFSLGMDDQCSGEEFHSNSGPDIITACYYEPEAFNVSLNSSLQPEKDLDFGTSSSADARFEFQSGQEVAKTGDSHINHLTGLSLRLAETLGKINGGRPSTTLDTLHFPTLDATSSPSTSTPIDEILGGTREFVKILAGLKPSNANNKSSSGSSVYGFMRSKGTAPMDGANENGGSYAVLLGKGEYQCNRSSSVYDLLHPFAEVALRDDPFICPIPHMTLNRLPLESGNLQEKRRMVEAESNAFQTSSKGQSNCWKRE